MIDERIWEINFAEGASLDQFWRCPVCLTTMAAGKPMELHPPRCGMGHGRTEMEQVTREAFCATPGAEDA